MPGVIVRGELGSLPGSDTPAHAGHVEGLVVVYQPDMVEVLRKRHGKKFVPNEYAAARIAYPAPDLWRVACKMNTKQGYTRFIEVWPTLDFEAKKKTKKKISESSSESVYRGTTGSEEYEFVIPRARKKGQNQPEMVRHEIYLSFMK